MLWGNDEMMMMWESCGGKNKRKENNYEKFDGIVVELGVFKGNVGSNG